MTSCDKRAARAVVAILSVVLLGLAAQRLRAAGSGQTPESTIVIVGGTVIDGNGGPPLKDATVLIKGKHIEQVGPRASVTVPAGALRIDATGKFITPGFVDTNVHVSLYGGGAKDRKETAVRYQEASARLTLEAAQMQLRSGITTIRDSYGALLPLIEVRDAIARGAAIGPRVLAAGNIVGWGGPYSISFALIPERDLSLYEEQFTDSIAQGAGEELMDMYPDELRVAINKYLDKGPNFIKYGGTSHWASPTFIGFSPDAQKVIVDETHKRGLVAETHATSPEGLKLAIEAGVDLIQHPEVLDGREMSDALVAQIRDRKIIGSMLVSSITGEAWKKHVKDKDAARRRIEERDAQVADRSANLKKSVPRAPTSAERRRDAQALGVEMDMRRRNAQKLIAAGCVITVGTDNYAGASPEFLRAPKPMWQEPGIGTIIAIEGLVELGMTPAQAIVAATRNGAIASKGLTEFGTIQAGKGADLLVLDADPLLDIANIRRLAVLVRDGRMIDRSKLPTDPIMFRPPS